MMKLKVEDGGSFNRMVKEAEEAAYGDESLKLSLLTTIIVQEFVDKHMQLQAASSMLILRQEEAALIKKKIDNLGFYMPKKRRSTVLNCKMITLKRCIDETQYNCCKKDRTKTLEKQRKNLDHQAEQVDNLQEPFKNRIIEEENGTDIILVMQKDLKDSDLNKNLNRLSIPRNKIKVEFLNEEEKEILNQGNGIQVLLIPPSLKENVTVELKKWAIGTTFSYNLIRKWCSSVVKDVDNGLEKGTMVQLWSFRKNSHLSFALVKVVEDGQNRLQRYSCHVT